MKMDGRGGGGFSYLSLSRSSVSAMAYSRDLYIFDSTSPGVDAGPNASRVVLE